MQSDEQLPVAKELALDGKEAIQRGRSHVQWVADLIAQSRRNIEECKRVLDTAECVLERDKLM